MSISYEVWEAWNRHLGRHRDFVSGPLPLEVIEYAPDSVSVEVRVPLDALACAAEDILRNNLRNITIRGFRPGHAPISLIRPQVRSWLLLSALNQLLQPQWDEHAATLPGQLIQTSELNLGVAADDGIECIVVTCECQVLPPPKLPPQSISLQGSVPPTPSSQMGGDQINLRARMAPQLRSDLLREILDIKDHPWQARINADCLPTHGTAEPPLQAEQGTPPAPASPRPGQADLEALYQTTTTPSILINLLTNAFSQVTEGRVNAETVREIFQHKLKLAQVAHAAAGQSAEEEIDLAGEVESRAAKLGIPAASFRARYLADEEQRELFTTRIRQDQALCRLGKPTQSSF